MKQKNLADILVEQITELLKSPTYENVRLAEMYIRTLLTYLLSQRRDKVILPEV